MMENSEGIISRRRFLYQAGAVAGLSMLALSGCRPKSENGGSRMTRITYTDSNFERERLIRPFGFKGGYVTNNWQTIALMESESGARKIGLCTQNVLWSDARVFAAHSENGGNALMYALTERALQIATGQSFHTRIDLLENLLGEVY